MIAVFTILIVVIPQAIAMTVLRKARRWPRALSLLGAFVSTMVLVLVAARVEYGRALSDEASPEWGNIVLIVAFLIAMLNVAFALLVPRTMDGG